MWKSLQAYWAHPGFRATGLAFSLNALLLTVWFTRLPEVKTTLELSDGDLGLALFFPPFGAILAMVFGGYFIQKWGEGRSTVVSAWLYILILVLPFMAPNWYWLSASLFFLGATFGFMDIAMNAAATTLENQYKRVIMSTCHGFFSLGGMIGALLGSLMIWLEVIPTFHAWGMMGLCSVLLLVAITGPIWSVKSDATEEGSHFALPGKAVLALAMIAFCTFLGEGAIADWSAVYLEKTLQADPAYLIGLGYAGFSLFMTLGRFMGDEWIARYGGGKVIRWGALTATAGGALVVFGNSYLAIAGFSLLGVGYSCMVPVLFSEAGRVPGVPAAQGIAAVATVGYAAFLLGPPLIGLIGDASNLRWGLSTLLILGVLTVLILPFVKFTDLNGKS
ncbi:MAG: MFS transporter, partial [Bacteroidota bacterium]